MSGVAPASSNRSLTLKLTRPDNGPVVVRFETQDNGGDVDRVEFGPSDARGGSPSRTVGVRRSSILSYFIVVLIGQTRIPTQCPMSINRSWPRLRQGHE